jgi:hypothetical protein
LFNLIAEMLKPPADPFRGGTNRVALTPGHLYRLMSAEFRAFRTGRCSCVMPMVVTHEPEPIHGCNWTVGSLASACERCEELVAEIVARHAAVYDVNDPTFTPAAPDPSEPSGSQGGRFPLFS